jgi:hypothetical protein
MQEETTVTAISINDRRVRAVDTLNGDGIGNGNFSRQNIRSVGDPNGVAVNGEIDGGLNGLFGGGSVGGGAGVVGHGSVHEVFGGKGRERSAKRHQKNQFLFHEAPS